jgi:hypothetical protein
VVVLVAAVMVGMELLVLLGQQIQGEAVEEEEKILPQHSSMGLLAAQVS